MKRLLFAAAAVSMAGMVWAQSAPRSDVEARLDALEVINVTAQKPAKANNEAPDPELDAILQAAAQAEAQG